jgi:hypothetical protein
MKTGPLTTLPYLMVVAMPLALLSPTLAHAANLPRPELSAGLDKVSGLNFFSLTWDAPVAIQAEQEMREVTLRFGQPLSDAPISDLGTQLVGAVESIRYGYDSVLLRLSPGVKADVVITATGVTVTFTRSATRQDRPIGPSQLNFVRAKALLGAGEVAAARAELQRFISETPLSPEIARTARVARIEGSSGSIWRSFSAFDRLLRSNPGNSVLLAHYATVLIDSGKLRLARNVLDY